jgi:DNA-binding response OmpR family regulator
MRLLLIEDDLIFSRALVKGLSKEGYIVDLAKNAKEGLFQSESYPYDLILLDLNLPDKDGLLLCKELKSMLPKTRIIITSARKEMEEVIIGLDAGADDYLTKPFHLKTLLARIRAVLRRGLDQTSAVLEYGNLKMNTSTRQTYVNDCFLNLTSKEYMILSYLLYHPEEIIDQTDLINQVWGEDDALFSNAIRTHICNLRMKLKEAGLKGVEIQTATNQGYSLNKIKN